MTRRTASLDYLRQVKSEQTPAPPAPAEPAKIRDASPTAAHTQRNGTLIVNSPQNTNGRRHCRSHPAAGACARITSDGGHVRGGEALYVQTYIRPCTQHTQQRRTSSTGDSENEQKGAGCTQQGGQRAQLGRAGLLCSAAMPGALVARFFFPPSELSPASERTQISPDCSRRTPPINPPPPPELAQILFPSC